MRRLVRYPDDGMIGGVAVGLGVYLGLDPVLVRVGFVLLTIMGGVGLPLYAVLWLVVPRADAAVHAEASSRRRATPSTSVRFWAGLGLAAIGAVALADAFDGPGNVLAAMALIGIGIALFTMDRGDRPEHPFGDHAPAVDTAVAPAASLDAVEEAATGVEDALPPTGGLVAPAVTAPASAPRQPRRRSILGRLTFAALLLWGGAALLVDEVTGVEVSAVVGISVALMIVGAGLIIGSWFGRARWLVVIGILLLPALGVAALFDDLDLPLRGPVGEVTLGATDDLSYHHFAGQVTVDLREAQPVEGETLSAQLGLTFGELIIRLPDDVRVELSLAATGGELDVSDGDTISGTRIRTNLVYNADATGGTVFVDARVGFGTIVLRGPATLDQQSVSASILEVRP